MQITGTIQGISQITQGTSASGNTYRKAEIVVKDSSIEYGDVICVSVFNDKCDLLASLQKGMYGTMNFRARVRTYNEKVYNDFTFSSFAPAVVQPTFAQVYAATPQQIGPAPKQVVQPQPQATPEDTGLPF